MAEPTDRGPVIQPVEFRPGRRLASGRRRFGLGSLLGLALLFVLAAVTFFLFTARSVELAVTPQPERLSVDGGLVPPPLGGRFLLRPGVYTVRAERAGHRPLETTIEVGPEPQQRFELVLEPLPGRLEVVARLGEGADGAPTLFVDGEALDAAFRDGVAGPVELAPGSYTVRVEAPRHRGFETEVELAGAGQLQRVEAVLEPRWAAVRFTSEPAGARLRVDGEARGTTPAVLDLLEGARGWRLTLAGYKPRAGRVEVVAGRDAEVGPVRLAPADGNVLVDSEPPEATVTIDGVYRGRTPLDLDLAPGRVHRLRLSRAGYAPLSEEVTVASGEARELRFELVARLGEVRVEAVPADAELRVDGEPRGEARQTLRLPAVAHRLEIRKPGYVPQVVEVTPLPGVPQTVEVSLDTVAEAKRAAVEPVIRSAEGHELRLVEPSGRLRMGASRREPGRRANETLRDVELTRPFYLGVHEVSNRQFRRFRAEHRSGTVGGESLDYDVYPVVRVSWQDAAAYCNWLSGKDGLPPAYVESGGELVAASPLTTGYRLPTEAEWAYAARRAGSGGLLKYPWGDELPIAPKSGNYADTTAQELVPGALPGYTDSYATTAPVDAFAPNAFGIHQLGGNVAEWVHDPYEIRSSLAAGGVERDPTGPASGELHVIRGSSWMHSTVTELRLSFRDYGQEPRPDVGFRIARYLERP